MELEKDAANIAAFMVEPIQGNYLFENGILCVECLQLGISHFNFSFATL